ncbi:MAG: hypothetical protein ACPGRX_03525 [Bdellovibrionales bacterium]
MAVISWAEISIDKDYETTLTQCLAAIHGLIADGAATNKALAFALIEHAQDVMDYEDSWGVLPHKDGALQRDSEFVQRNRLANFISYIAEFTDKRVALLHDIDGYMDQKILKYKQVAKTHQTPARPAFGGETDYDAVFETLEDLEVDLITQGLSRLTQAKALIDCAFLCARLENTDTYSRFCLTIKTALAEGRDISNISDIDQTMQDSTRPLVTMSAAGSVSIH